MIRTTYSGLVVYMQDANQTVHLYTGIHYVTSTHHPQVANGIDKDPQVKCKSPPEVRQKSEISKRRKSVLIENQECIMVTP